MVKNRFEQVDERQEDAITLLLKRVGAEDMGSVVIPAAANPQMPGHEMASGQVAAKDAFRNAVRFANEMKLAVVVCDPENLWKEEWGKLYRPVD